jgi:hypothetical protein
LDETDPFILSWDDYVRPSASLGTWFASREAHAAAFDDQRRLIADLLTAHRPQRVACLGSGHLNDLPVAALLSPERDNFWVDWVAGISVEGVRGTTISESEGQPSCLFCTCPVPQRYCGGYRGPVAEREQVCAAFEAIPEPSLHCANYAPGNDPVFLVHDVTSGRGTRFARRADRMVRASTRPEEAFRRAIAECRRWAAYREPIPVPEGSIDFVTSSMVASQFDAEPYTYFSKLLEIKFGRDPILRKADRIERLMEELRAELFRIQMEGHAEELHRLVRKDRGRVYFSVELFRSAPVGDRYFVVHEIPEALAILGRRFEFDFGSISHDRILRPANLGGATSIILSVVLVPR